METHPTLDKIQTLRSKFNNPAFENDVQQINDWEASVLDLVAREELATNPKIQEIIRGLQDDVKIIVGKLLTYDSLTLSDAQRDRLLDEKKLYEAFMVRFDLQEIRKALESVDKAVQEELTGVQ